MKRLLTQRAAPWLWVLGASLTPLAAWSAPAPEATGTQTVPATTAVTPTKIDRLVQPTPAILAWHRVGSPAPTRALGIA